MDAAKVCDTLHEITRVEGELAATRRAPPSHDEQIARARAALDHAGEMFRAQPFRVATSGPASIQAAIAGAMMGLAPASAIEAVEKAIKSSPQGLDGNSRAARIAACEAKIGTLIRSFSFDDLRQMRRQKDEAFVYMRGLAARRDELRAVIERRTRAIHDYCENREELRDVPSRDAYEVRPPRLNRTARDTAALASDQWLRAAERELAAEWQTINETLERYGIAADDWRRLCLVVEQLEKMLPGLPAPLEEGVR